MKIKAKYKILFLSLTLLSVMGISCTDDFVDTTEEYSIDSETYFNSEIADNELLH